MSNQRLGRAVIECGRPGYSKLERKVRNKSLRRWKLVDGEYEPGPKRGDNRQLSDNLNPLRRWLEHKAGKSWAKVFSEFCAREDKRTLRGEHIHRHMREMVKNSGWQEGDISYQYTSWYNPPCYRFHGYWSFWVDERGILRHHGRKDCEAYGKKVGWKPTPSGLGSKPYVAPVRTKIYRFELDMHLAKLAERPPSYPSFPVLFLS